METPLDKPSEQEQAERALGVLAGEEAADYRHDMQELVGKRVMSVRMNLSHDYVVFDLADGDKLVYAAVGECCSRSWFEHMEGADCLVGEIVTGVRVTSLPQQDSADGYDVTRIDNISVFTLRGRCVFDFRNESNGYYSGSADLCETEPGGAGVQPCVPTQDF